jgi:ABC-type multidrug transport system ATPase subunit
MTTTDTTSTRATTVPSPAAPALPPTGPADAPPGADAAPVALAAHGISVVTSDRVLLHPADLVVGEGQVVGVAGPSGAGKSTLLEALAGLRPLATGHVALTDPAARVGFVPQADLVHPDLPLDRTLRLSARLRLPGVPRPLRDQVVADLLQLLDLDEAADVRVRDLSGGQRKRASLATELLSRPTVLLLDEPTSGLDPASAGDVLAALRRLADQGVTVVMATHDPQQLLLCDQVVLVRRGGHVAFHGTPAAAVDRFGDPDLAGAYRRLGDPGPDPTDDAPPSTPTTPTTPPSPARPQRRTTRRPGAAGCGSALHQVHVLARRNVALMGANRLTLAVLLGSPVLVIAMMAVLFPAGGFRTGAEPIAPQLVFWIAFAGFFFGLTSGLLQVVGEQAIVRRERVAGVRSGAFVTSKVVVLLPLLAAVDAGLLGVLRLADRIPEVGGATAAGLLLTLVLESAAALALGLATSALVRDAAQATLALPLLCFPQVLFAGAVVPLDEMAVVGRLLSTVLATRWSFEALGHLFGVQDPRLADAFAGPPGGAWVVLLVMAVVGTAAATAAVHRR